jgi:hypothetical protein
VLSAEALRQAEAPLVDGLSDELADPPEVAEYLRNDSTPDEARRNAALRVLLRRSQTPG